MVMTAKPSKTMAYHEELLPLKSHDQIITWSFDFGFLLYDLYV